MLSIYVPVYNHEAYIAQALDSILMQKVNFKYEVLVGDDVSTDNTRAILESYQKAHPDVFTMFYRDHNMYREPINNGRDLLSRCKGKYIIPLEGDDFWTDELKLQKQVDFLEAHPEYQAVAHNCVVVGADSQPIDEAYPECKDTEYTLDHYAFDIMPGQSATVMCRNFVTQNLYDTSFMDLNLVPGDRRKYFTLVANGRVYCMQEVMSAYRHVTSGGSSFSANHQFNYPHLYKWHVEQLKYARTLSNKKAVLCAEMLLLMTVFYGFRKHYVSFSQALKDIKILKRPFAAFLFLLRRWSKKLLG